MSSRLKIWLRGETALNLLISTIDIIDLNFDAILYASKLIAYHRRLSDSSLISYKEWMNVAVIKNNMNMNAAFAYFSAAQTMYPCKKVTHPDYFSSKNEDIFIDVAHLAICLALQGARITANRMPLKVPDERYPEGNIRAKNSKLAQFDSALCFEFLNMNMERFISMICLVDRNIPIADPHNPRMMETNELINWHIVANILDCILEGIIAINSTEETKILSRINPKKLTVLLQKQLNHQKMIKFKSMILLLKGALCQDPYMIQGDFFTTGKKQTKSPLPYRLLSVKNWSGLEMFADSKFEGVHLRISKGQNARPLFFGRWLETVIVEDCQNCLNMSFLAPIKQTIFLRNLRNCSISVFASRIIIENCQNCHFFLFTLIVPILIGRKNAHLIFAPYNIISDALKIGLEKLNMDYEKNFYDSPIDLLSLFANKSKNIPKNSAFKIMNSVDFKLQSTPFAEKDAIFKGRFLDILPPEFAKQSRENEKKSMEIDGSLGKIERERLFNLFKLTIIKNGSVNDLLRVAFST